MKIDIEKLTEIKTSIDFLRSLYHENETNNAGLVNTLLYWKQKHGVNILAGPNLLAFGWAVVVRLFELTKEKRTFQHPNKKEKKTKNVLPDDLRNELVRLAALKEFNLCDQQSLEKCYQCTVRKIDLGDAADYQAFVSSLVRHLRNAFSHFDCRFDESDLNELQIVLKHVHGDETRLDMTIKLDGFLKLIGQIGCMFCRALETVADRFD